MPCVSAFGKAVQAFIALIALMPNQIETAGQTHLIRQDFPQVRMKRQREIMGDADPGAQRNLPQLNRDRIRCKRDTVNADVVQIIQLSVKDHVRDVTNQTMPFQIPTLIESDHGAFQIILRGHHVQFVVADFLDQQLSRPSAH